MRQTSDRIRHAIGFELVGLLGAMPLMSILFGVDPMHSGAMGLFFSVVATLWNYKYNAWFDGYLQRRQGNSEKSQQQRIIHALGFEAGLLVITIPVMAWWFEVSLLQALIMDAAMIVYYLFFAYGYNLAYDKLFPVLGQVKAQSCSA
ncbi:MULTISPECIES: PACE efflux transporter [unclassified Agarivorans]|uniref:PACE efflux transporter n=1 Tax=unclassified Agarivorans TaxID=2636026 RepID=UPI0026E11456|nr:MULTISPECIES: PACE efflux transporter [unclassified Agarivorans]MDO6688015.1 PACE efflux transporter [Agarivorans sp. 3_MG-2023]MDO6715282.1 PACE efflux transporter [Agarivorans sp. 2_MG-2023]